MKKYMLAFFGGNMALRYDNLGKAESLDQTAEVARSSPIIKNGGYVLARPCGEMK